MIIFIGGALALVIIAFSPGRFALDDRLVSATTWLPACPVLPNSFSFIALILDNASVFRRSLGSTFAAWGFVSRKLIMQKF